MIWRSVQEVLMELVASGTVLTDGANQNRRYQLDPAPWSGWWVSAELS